MNKKILLLSICGLVLFTGCFNNKKDVTDSKNIEFKIDKEENLTLDYSIIDNDNMILTLKNTGNEVIDYVNVDIALFDKEDNLIRVEKQYARNIIANSENVLKVALTQVEENGETSTLPYRVEIALNKTIYSTKFETAYSDKISGSVEKAEVDGQLNLVITNNSGVVIDDLSAAVVFYKDSKIVDIYTVSAQNVDTTTSQVVYIPTTLKDKQVSYIEYDEVKVVINNASRYNTEV